MVPIRSRKTGAEKNVSERTAQIILNTHAFSKDWEIVKTPQPVPGEVIQFQEAKLVEQQAEFTVPQEKTVIEQEPPVQVIKTTSLCNLSCKKISDTIEYLKEEELRELLNDPRKTAKSLAEAELVKRGLK